MAGYSGTPLVKKLGFKEGQRAALVNAPAGFKNELEQLPAAVQLATGRLPKELDLIVFFADSQRILRSDFKQIARQLRSNGMLWIAWRKKSSGLATDLSENTVRDIGLAAGLVDVKVCAINEIWSGLKFVYRLRDRAGVQRNPVR